MRSNSIVLSLSAAVLALAVSSCSSTTQGGADGPTPTPASTSNDGPKSVATRGNAPDFTLPTLDGSNMSLSEHAGKSVVLIDFWSTTCQPCLVEMPHLVELYEKYKSKGFIVLAVAADGPETMSAVSSVVHDKKMTFPVLLDEETSVIARYNPKKERPFWVLIDRSGNVVTKKNGYSPGDEKVLAAEIEKLLQAK